MADILVVEDEKNIRESLEEALSGGHTVKAAENGKKALEMLEAGHFDMLITDISMPGISGLELTRKFREMNSAAPVIVITAFSSIQSAVDAMKSGASEYIPKPFSLDEIEIKVNNLLKAVKIESDREFYAGEKDELFGSFIGNSPAIMKVKNEIKKVSGSGVTVLITGETGTGKEMAAYTIHKLSGAKGPFVPVHCAAYAKGVIESELFGHEKGAFTGAEKQRKGKIEYAAGGTLFLDEMGDIPPDIQVKLLRVLENRIFERVGGNKPVSTNAGIICATNRNLEEMIKNGSFREDLYYRINVFPVHLPPLREREGDIIQLAKYFSAKKGSFKFDAMNGKLLEEYSWPGNVRELQNIIERAIVLSDNNILRIDLAFGKKNDKDAAPAAAGSRGLDEIMGCMEKDIILTALKKYGYNQSKTAKELKINRTTLQYKMGKYEIKVKDN